ncbi:ABC transporter permease, partial [Gemmatimonadota bacterium]
MRSFLMDLRHSARMLFKHPMLTVTCVVTISLGIGLTTTMFSVINGSIWEQLPYDDADRLMIIARTNLTQSQSRMGVSIHDFEDWRSRQTTFEDITAWYGGTINLNNEGETPIRYQGAFIVPSAFDLIGVPPLMGRVFTDEERLPEAASVIVLSYRVWQARFGGDPEILGSTVRVNGLPTTVIGVMPEGYAFPNQEDVWVPQKQDPSQIERNGGVLLQVVGKLKEGVSQAQAQAEFSVIAAALAEEYPETNEDIGARVMGYDEAIMDTEDRTILYLMLAGMFAVLLIACFNVANLLLSRAVIRSKEMAVRSSLGATRRALVGQMLLEALAFAVVGGALGLLLGHIGISIFDRAAASTEPPWWFDFSIDGTVALFVLLLVVLSAVVSGILPALQSSSTGVTEILK